MGGFRTMLGVPLAARRNADRRDRLAAQDGAAVHRQADRAGHHLRRPGGDRDRERAAVRRGAGAHARTVRGAGAADGDLGGAAGHLQLAGRAGAGVPGHAGERDAHLRGQVRHACYSTRAMRSALSRMHNAPPAFAEAPAARAGHPPRPGHRLGRACCDEAGGPHRRHSGTSRPTSSTIRFACARRTRRRAHLLSCRCSRRTS